MPSPYFVLLFFRPPCLPSVRPSVLHPHHLPRSTPASSPAYIQYSHSTASSPAFWASGPVGPEHYGRFQNMRQTNIWTRNSDGMPGTMPDRGDKAAKQSLTQMSEYMSDRMLDRLADKSQIECQKEKQRRCQIEHESTCLLQCQKIYQIECPNGCQSES